MGWKTVVIGTECTVSLTLNRMKITIGNEYQNIPLCDLDTVIFSHDRITMTIPMLSKLVENNINVIICDSKNDPIGIFQPFNNHSLVFKQLNKQINWKIYLIIIYINILANNFSKLFSVKYLPENHIFLTFLILI